MDDLGKENLISIQNCWLFIFFPFRVWFFFSFLSPICFRNSLVFLSNMISRQIDGWIGFCLVFFKTKTNEQQWHQRQRMKLKDEWRVLLAHWFLTRKLTSTLTKSSFLWASNGFGSISSFPKQSPWLDLKGNSRSLKKFHVF